MAVPVPARKLPINLAALQIKPSAAVSKPLKVCRREPFHVGNYLTVICGALVSAMLPSIGVAAIWAIILIGQMAKMNYLYEEVQ